MVPDSGCFAGAGRFIFSASRFHAALINECARDFPHHRVIRAADQHRGSPLLRHETHLHQFLTMVGQGRRRDADPLLQTANGHAGIASTHKGLENAEPGRVAEGFKTGCDIINVHISIMFEIRISSTPISIFIEIYM
jgi:hypothetical protein